MPIITKLKVIVVKSLKDHSLIQRTKMGTSLQLGIEAAKAGKLSLALEHLKAAVVEEPENPEVWVWLSGIIDDEEKQLIFLKKALELDPNNSAAQRGIAYLQRHKYVPSQSPLPGSKLSIDKTSTQDDQEALEYPDPDYLTINVESFAKQVDAIGDPQAPSRDEIIRESKELQKKPKRSWLDILIYGLTLIVFTIIGVLIGVTIKNQKVSIPEPTATFAIGLSSPDEGVYLYVDDMYYKMELGHNSPAEAVGIPTTFSTKPRIVANTSLMVSSNLLFLNKEDQEIPFSIQENSKTSFTLSPVDSLTLGQYCLVHPISEAEQALYWCFKVVE
jgi:tetratricopeptide (TPR) repeat protein